MFRLSLLSLLVSVPSIGAAVPTYAVSPAMAHQYVETCGGLPSEAQMVADIRRLLEAGRPTTFRARILLDGFQLEQINTFDLRVIDRLTSHRDMHSIAWRDFYKTEEKYEKDHVAIERLCSKPSCVERKMERPARLVAFNPAHPCRDALCAAEAIFGVNRGRQILWAYLNYGVNLSPYSDLNADKVGFTEAQLRAILIALSAMPVSLRAEAFDNFGFFRFQRGYTMALYQSENTIANGLGAVFDPIEKADFAKLIFVFVHELGHRAARRGGVNLDDSAEWLEAIRGPETISLYAKTHAREDFAESFALYRLNSETLRSISPARYEFMKNRVFKGRDFSKDLCAR